VINATQLLNDLKRQLKKLEDDLRARIADVPDLKAGLVAEWEAARSSNRTAETFESWADQVITQAGVHWLLSCVFIRFIEDNELVDRPWLGGTPESGRLALARDRHEAYFRAHPTESDREYLLTAFREAGALPGLHTFFDEVHNPVFRLGISGDAAMALRQFWQQVDPNTGLLAHDFTDPDWNTRFLGDLYQDLSEATRKRYALLQTPEFVEEFILDRTLTPAIREFGIREVRMIDPTCGSGHFLLGGFHRLAEEWARAEPGRNRRDIAQKALDAVAGVDLNPFAVAIARFRLLLAALNVGEVRRLADAPNYKLNVAIGDSLLHGKRFGLTTTDGMFEDAVHYTATGLSHAYASEDLDEVNRILGRQYHAVVGNPPYIVVKDAALNAAYRQRYTSCHMKYSLGAPFTERFFDLALKGDRPAAGFVGLITANSFMKREFGSKLIEKVLPQLDLTHVIDTAGAYIPGHGTPTVILFGRHRAPVGDGVRTVMGIKGEPSTPDDPAQGLVWSAIVGQIDLAGSELEFVSVADIPRANFGKHPWSIGGGGATSLMETIESQPETLGAVTAEIGITAVTGSDDVFLLANSAHARRVGIEHVRPFVTGTSVRDWSVESSPSVWLYDENFDLLTLESLPRTARYLWPVEKVLSTRKRFGTPMLERGLTWYEYQELYVGKLRTPLCITFAFVATHNHFVLDRGGKVFNRHAQVIKLRAGGDESEYLDLLGPLNSSVACFWMKQVFHNKGSTVDQHGARQRTDAFEDFYEYTSTGLNDLPITAQRPIELGRKLDALATMLAATRPAALLEAAVSDTSLPGRAALDAARARAASLRAHMIALQEELDWKCYDLYGLLPPDMLAADVECTAPPEIALGERAFEIVLARRMAAGQEATTWFERHGSAHITEIPAHWPEDYRQVVQRRIKLIERDRNIGLIERPEYKRRWNETSWDELERTALRDWLLDRLEAAHLWPASDEQPPQLTTVNRLTDTLRNDAAFTQVAELYAGHSGFDLAQIVADLVAGESVSFLPVLRYTDTGLRKRAQWEDTWALQRREDAGENVGKIPVPPKYQSKDFLKADFWRLRGGLDVPKERWVSYPSCERGTDTSLVIAWAGWDHLQQATALAGFYLEMKDNEGWPRERLQPLLAGLLELVPWLKQWHNEVHPSFGERMGDYYEGFLNDQARELGFTVEDLRTWKPAASSARRGRRPRAETSNT
jgi:hypothetical protein